MTTHFFVGDMVITKIKNLIEPLLSSEGVELVDVELKGARGNQILRIYVDITGGIDLNTCAHLSTRISDILDTADIFPNKYRLEVSSPGVDRPLKTAQDFRRNQGREVQLTYFENGQQGLAEGTILEVGEQRITIQTLDGISEISLHAVKKARIKLKW